MNKKERREKIAKNISRVLTVLFLGFIAYLAFQIAMSDIEKAKAANDIGKSPIAIDRGRDYGEAGYRKVAENDKYILRADLTSGAIQIEEKKTDKIWYSNPPDYEEDQIAVLKQKLQAQVMISCLNIETRMTTECNNYSDSVKLGGMDYEILENGIQFNFSYPVQGIIVPVCYTLNEDGFTASIVTSQIQELWSEKYLLMNVSLLPLFGAGGLTDEGYLFVPDGSGALIQFNNNKQRYMSYQGQVYGEDLGIVKNSKITSNQAVRMPVFGIKCNDNGFLAIISSGDGSSNLFASVSQKTNSYNYVYSQATIRNSSYQHSSGNSTGGLDYTENLLKEEDYSVKYIFLDPDQADYVGMSQKYKEYLQKENKLKNSALAKNKYLILDLYGAVSIEQYVMGIKTKVETPLTTYDDVRNIVQDLKQMGVENLIINYIGALDDGFEGEVSNKLRTASSLGSKKDFQEMLQYLEEENVLLFLENDPINLYESGNGYSVWSDSSKTYFNGYAYQYKYGLENGNRVKGEHWYLLQPRLVPGLIEKFTDSLVTEDVRNLSLAGIGEYLYTNYAQNGFSGRPDTMKIWSQTMEKFTASADYLMVHGGNAYSLPYADVITDCTVSSTGYDMADQSIPFYQMILQGSTVLGTVAVNSESDYHNLFLKAVETGSSLKYAMISTDPTVLIGTEYDSLVYTSYERWRDTAVAQYLELQNALGEVSDEQILSHNRLQDDVTITIYESGTGIIVNYGEESYSYNGKKVEGGGYLVVKGADL
ncbi:MAG: hypothetical protein E7293_03745 [Lachnospiraceae bacterium]|nr:hypothetical protein [Lachnospiraceae bacterium]